MKKENIVASVAMLLAGIAWSQDTNRDAKKTTVTPESLQAEINALRPDRHVWREIDWKTCPLDALKDSRQMNKPVIAWVFLGLPSDERC